MPTHVHTTSELLNQNETPLSEEIQISLFLPCADEITLSLLLGSKNQILIIVNQTLQIMEEYRKGQRIGLALQVLAGFIHDMLVRSKC